MKAFWSACQLDKWQLEISPIHLWFVHGFFILLGSLVMMLLSSAASFPVSTPVKRTPTRNRWKPSSVDCWISKLEDVESKVDKYLCSGNYCHFHDSSHSDCVQILPFTFFRGVYHPCCACCLGCAKFVDFACFYVHLWLGKKHVLYVGLHALGTNHNHDSGLSPPARINGQVDLCSARSSWMYHRLRHGGHLEKDL